MANAIYFATAAEWEAWLAKNYSEEREIWLIFYKTATGQASIPYEDAVEVALSYGWIDSLIQKMDEERYARKFTPRTNTEKWSVSNQRRVAKLVREGRMKEPGLAKMDGEIDYREDLKEEKPHPLQIPPEVERGLQANAAAWENFNRLPPSHQRRYIGWITDAKRAETIQRRIEEALRLLEKGERLGMK